MKKRAIKKRTKSGRANPVSSDIATVDGIIRALYESISFSAGEEPDWMRLRSLCLEGAIMLPLQTPDGAGTQGMDLGRFIEMARKRIEKNRTLQTQGFVEREIARRVESFGGLAHVFSTYEGRFSEDDPAPITRGINSIQLVRRDKRWSVASIVWVDETQDVPIPAKYLPSQSSG